MQSITGGYKMKIRKDFVTNSSSTSFGAATANGFISAIISALGLSSAMAASDAADGFSEENQSKGLSGPDRDFDPDELIQSDLDYEDKVSRLDEEISAYEKEWQETKETLDDRDYEDVKKQYEEYIDYLSDKKEEAGVVEFERQVEALNKEAEKEYKNEWIQRQKDDLKNTRDQIEMIEATIKGYGGENYDISQAKSQLEMYKSKEKDLSKTLKKEGIDFDYQAPEREPIGPSQVISDKMKEIDRAYEKAMKAIENEKKDRKKKEIIRRNMDAWRESSKASLKYSNTADNYLKTAEVVQTGADIGVDALEKVTGPAGKTIKKVYVASKGVAGGLGEAYADPANASTHIAKGIVKGGGDLAKTFAGDADKKLLEEGIGLVSEVSQGAIDSYQKGESVVKGMGKGVKNTLVDVIVDRGMGKILPDNAREIDFGEYTGKEIYNGIVKGNPTIKDFLKENFKESIKNNAINQGKNIPKGQGFIFDDIKLDV